ncbi:D-hexose-6-phosphate mutarotase [Candidatus Colwellia aromaticivorans]|uniref:D-hexose-6-phosphate mutarotase n=1 Tax=Candidatus Colwellia aromaticivorans TaxID=2267621 RepID=UPI000DF10DE8|nr:D-hexose-6-phosphate mutarotase [Candidatus Colwellia aromaticivorans]
MSLLVKNDFGQVQQVKLSSDLSALIIEHKNTQAKVSLYGGQVLSWQPTDEKEVFWLSKSSDFEQGKAIRGGIPLCWPWFGVHPNDTENKEGNHGFARCQLWKIDKIDINEQGVEVSLSWQGKSINELWPFACRLTQVLFFGKSFNQVFTMTNLSENEAYYTGALHSYLSVSAPVNTTIAELAKAPFDDKLTGKACTPEPLATTLANGIEPVDRVYHCNDVMTVVDTLWQRTIELKTTNTNQWVFWNPGVKLANNMMDIHESGEQEFICLEAANTKKQLLGAGKSLTMEQNITVIPVSLIK